MCHEGLSHDPLATNGSVSERRTVVGTDGTELPVFIAEPKDAPKGRVLIIHDIHGANDFYHDLARRFANNGFSAYLPDFFVREGPLPEQSSEAARARGALLSYPQVLKDAANLLDAEEDGPSWGVVGFCMGGTLVMHLASSEKRLTAGVIYYGFPANPNITANRPTEPMRETSLVDMPLLGFWGDQDQAVGMHNVEQYRSLLTNADKDFEFHIYPDRGHGFLTFDENSPNYDASLDSWGRALEFFGNRLAG
jgi:carboxymethylenebutenolidase